MNAVDRYSCEEVFRRLNDYLDRELSPVEIAMVKEHLDTCRQCASEHAFEASVLRELKSKLRRIDLHAFDGAQDGNRRRDRAVAVKQGGANQPDNEKHRSP